MFAAIRMARRTRRHQAKVTLVNPSSRFTERLRMHQMATGQELEDLQIPDMIAGTGIEFVPGWADHVDPDRHEVLVTTEDGPVTLRYDYLIYAIGSAADTHSVPGADLHAF